MAGSGVKLSLHAGADLIWRAFAREYQLTLQLLHSTGVLFNEDHTGPLGALVKGLHEDPVSDDG